MFKKIKYLIKKIKFFWMPAYYSENQHEVRYMEEQELLRNVRLNKAMPSYYNCITPEQCKLLEYNIKTLKKRFEENNGNI